MKFVISEEFRFRESEIKNIIQNLPAQGETVYAGRNTVKKVSTPHGDLNIKAFRVPNLINQIAYRFLRKSKAQRSYEYAQKLADLDIGTPTPIAYATEITAAAFKKSYYVSQHLDYDFTYREIIEDGNLKNKEEILIAFSRWMYKVHNAGVLFKDHSPGNTLIKKTRDGYDFFLVDLNRMEFKSLSDEERLRNFERLAPYDWIYKIMADSYAEIAGYNAHQTYETMINAMHRFQNSFHARQRRKKKFKKWLGRH